MKLSHLLGTLALALLLGACGSETDEPQGQQVPLCSSETDQICGTSCVDTSSDVRHCGGCDNACAEGQVCSDGACVLQCPAAQQICDSACFQLATSPQHCGACGNACAPGQACADGTCVDACPSHQTVCEGGCFDLGSSADHCGACGDACGAGEVCSGGACVANCADGHTDCEGGCFDLETSRPHCGACGNSCGEGELCSEGSCVVTCPSHQAACDGGCFDLQTSSNHCGACGIECAEGQACVDGACVAHCGDGYTDCDGTCRNLQDDKLACGACGNVCAGDEICVDGSCELHCAGELSPCGTVCRDLTRDRTNCGACGIECAEGELCVDGACAQNCVGFSPTACEGSCTNTDFDPLNCGGCGNICGANEVCSFGACVTACDPDADLCVGGCTDLESDPANCGECGTVCGGGPNMIGVCSEGACATACLPGFADCDGDPSNGCEMPTDVDPSNCGGCGISCDVPNATASCTAGTCVISACEGDYVDCDGDPLTGCEADFDFDSNNCTACGIACPAGQACIEGGCEVVVGEDCNTHIEVHPGLNLILWNAGVNNYIVDRVSCNSTGSPEGGDIVLRYDAPASGTVEIQFDKPTSTRWETIVSDLPCGRLYPEVLCAAEFSGTTLGGTFNAVAGRTYWIYISDNSSGANPLSNPLALEITQGGQSSCPSTEPVTGALYPPAGQVTENTRPGIMVSFRAPVRPDTGTVTITGTGGTNRTIQLPSNDVVFSYDNQMMEILPGEIFPGNQQLTVTLTGIQDADCGGGTAAPISWSFDLPTVPCAPGQGGMVGNTITRVWPNMANFTLSEYYIVPDADPNGWVYMGGTTQLYRVAKNGDRAPEQIHGQAGIGSTHLGYAMLIDGPNVYTVDSATSGTNGRIYRITSDGGATWTTEDAITFASAPGDDFRAVAKHGDLLYLVTHEATSSASAEIWTADISGTIPATATLLTSWDSNSGAGHLYCSSIAVDDPHIYTVCRQADASTSDYAIMRFDRLASGPPVQLVTHLSANTTVSSLEGHDVDGDGTFDFLYFTVDREEGQFICGLDSTPYVDLHYSFGDGTGNYGGGLDAAAGVIWAYDDDTQELIRIE